MARSFLEATEARAGLRRVQATTPTESIVARVMLLVERFMYLHPYTVVRMALKRKYKMVRIPEDEYDELLKARRELMRKGLDSLPDDLLDEDDENRDDEEDGNFTMGLLVGLGAAALVYLLTQKKQERG